MINAAILANLEKQLESLKCVVKSSSDRAIANPPDLLFYEQQNVFIKAYLVSACSMLEAFIQDIAADYVENLQNRINSANLPLNLVTWVVDHEKAKKEFVMFEAKKTKKDVSDMISPNYWKTVKAFERIGVDIASSEINNYKDFISAIVEKRNKIVHHNDDALDISFSDIIDTIDKFGDYAKCLHNTVSADSHLQS